MTNPTKVRLVWDASSSDIEPMSDGGGEFPSAYRLTSKGAAKIAVAVLSEIGDILDECQPRGQYERFWDARFTKEFWNVVKRYKKEAK